MASSGIQISAVLALVILIWTQAQAQSSSSGCTNVLIGMVPCLSYVTGSSPNPSASCCSQLASVVQSQPRCLCSVLNGGGSALGININQALALKLPGACKVQTPPVSNCNAENGPAVSPAAAPEAMPEADLPNETPDSN